MANIQERRDKSGKLISYSVRVHRGRGADGRQLKPWTATFDVSPTWTEKSAKKKAEAFAATFEKECREGVTSDSRQKFAPYCDYVIALKAERGTAKHSTIVRYKELTARIYPEIGHIRLKDLRTDHLNTLYTNLGKAGSGKRKPRCPVCKNHPGASSADFCRTGPSRAGRACTLQRCGKGDLTKGAAERGAVFPAGGGGGDPGRPGGGTHQMENAHPYAADHRRTARGDFGPQMGQGGPRCLQDPYLQQYSLCPGCRGL